MFVLFFQASPVNKNDSVEVALDDFALEPWSSKRLGILSKYTTSEKLTITTVRFAFYKDFNFLSKNP